MTRHAAGCVLVPLLPRFRKDVLTFLLNLKKKFSELILKHFEQRRSIIYVKYEIRDGAVGEALRYKSIPHGVIGIFH
jgi:hypothetical protein